MLLLIHHGSSVLENTLNVYEGGTMTKLKFDVDRWRYFELVGIMKELGYREINTILYKDPTFGMHVLSDDKGAFDIVDLCKLHFSVDIYIQYDVFESEFY